MAAKFKFSPDNSDYPTFIIEGPRLFRGLVVGRFGIYLYNSEEREERPPVFTLEYSTEKTESEGGEKIEVSDLGDAIEKIEALTGLFAIEKNSEFLLFYASEVEGKF